MGSHAQKIQPIAKDTGFYYVQSHLRLQGLRKAPPAYSRRLSAERGEGCGAKNEVFTHGEPRREK